MSLEQSLPGGSLPQPSHQRREPLHELQRDHDLVQQAKGGKLNAGSSGKGTPRYLTLALFNDLNKTDIQHVPFKGFAPAIPDRIGGQLDVPLTAEAGAPRLPVESGTAVIASVSTPEAMVAKLCAEVLKIMATPDMDERARAQGIRVDARGPQAFGKFLGDEIHRWSRIIVAAKITTETGAVARSASAGIEACRADRGSG